MLNFCQILDTVFNRVIIVSRILIKCSPFYKKIINIFMFRYFFQSVKSF